MHVARLVWTQNRRQTSRLQALWCWCHCASEVKTEISGKSMSGKAPLTTESKCPVTHIGSGFDPFDGDPYDFYTMARREEPIFYNPQLGYWVVTRYNDVRRIFLDSPTFSAAVALELCRPLCQSASQAGVE